MASLRDLCGNDVGECLDALNEAAISSAVGTSFFINDAGLTLSAALSGKDRLPMSLSQRLGSRRLNETLFCQF